MDDDSESEKPAKKIKKLEPDIVQKITVYVEIQAQASWQQSKASKKAETKPVIKKGSTGLHGRRHPSIPHVLRRVLAHIVVRKCAHSWKFHQDR